jgi:Bacterial TniB protein
VDPAGAASVGPGRQPGQEEPGHRRGAADHAGQDLPVAFVHEHADKDRGLGLRQCGQAVAFEFLPLRNAQVGRGQRQDVRLLGVEVLIERAGQLGERAGQALAAAGIGPGDLGPTNNGKSMIVEKFRRTHPGISHADREEIPVLVVQMPSEPSVLRFYTALLAAMGAPLRPRQRLAELEQLALGLLRTLRVRMLVVDELHNVLAGRGETRREFLNLIRFLGNELRIPLVGVGTREAYLAIRSDDQLENRFAPLTLPRSEPDAQACSLLASFAAAFPLRRPSPIATVDMARYLLTRSEGTIGELTALLTDAADAAVAAIKSGEEAINHRTLLLADYDGPTERRRLFERELA